ncbi:MAG: glycosyltransferase family 4 protein [Acidobacteria bacterium]|nr:glycosyltransferase family 4 protein [Acidobacteriota bacterium]
MHVLVTADTVGGVWTYTRELVTGLSQRGHRVTLISFGAIPRPGQAQWLEALENVDFRPTGFRLEWMQDAAEDVAASAEYLQSVIADVKPELLHLNQYCYGALPSDLPRVVVAHSDVVSWWFWVHGCWPDDGPWLRWYRSLVSEGLARATAVVAPSQFMAENLVRDFGAGNNVRVIHNGRTPALFDAQSAKQLVVLSVGRIWDEAKNTALLLEAAPACPVWIAGTQRNPEAQRTVELRNAGEIDLKGQLSEPELRRLYARAGIYAATSVYEPFGLAPLEAALSRCAIVASDIPPFRELWQDSVLYFENRNAESLRGCVQQLLHDTALREEYGCRARRRAIQAFRAGRMLDEYIALYGELLGQRAPRASAVA